MEADSNMCGICGIMVEHGIEMHVGKLLAEMADRLQIRAQDSAGAAVFSAHPRETVLLQLLEIADGTQGSSYRFYDKEVSPQKLKAVLREINANPRLYLVGHGQHMTLVKELGLAREVYGLHGIDSLIGSHAIGHLRIATSSATTPINAHPHGTPSRQDIAVVHNGEITNYGRLRRLLELQGHNIVSQCDSEIIATFLADRLIAHGDFKRANMQFVEIADGPFTFIAGTENAIAVTRDRYGLRKAIVGYTPQTDGKPGFIAIATDVSALNAIGANQTVFTPPHASTAVFYRGEDFSGKIRGTSSTSATHSFRSDANYREIDVARLRVGVASLGGVSREMALGSLRDIAAQYGVGDTHAIPDGVVRVSYEKFGGVANSPIVLTRIVNAAIRSMIEDGVEHISIRNPEGLYWLATGLEGKVDISVNGDVGNSFGASSNIDGTVRIYGTAENGLANHAHKGRYVVHGIVTELAGQTNQGADLLLLQGATERIGAQMRGGSIVTFGLGYNSGLFMNGGVILNLSSDQPGEEIGSGMTGGVIYAPNTATVGKDAKKLLLEESDYAAIQSLLRKHNPEIRVSGLGALSGSSPEVTIQRNGTEATYNFRNFVKIAPK